MNILFTDDYSGTTGIFRLCFTLKGHEFYTAHNGQEALQIVEQHGDTLDVIILDYHMPEMNGLQVVQRIREMQGVPSIPIIMFTSDSRESLKSRAQELGVVRVVHKPVMPWDLIDLAQEVVEEATTS